jgi:hypothetical protein
MPGRPATCTTEGDTRSKISIAVRSASARLPPGETVRGVAGNISRSM